MKKGRAWNLPGILLALGQVWMAGPSVAEPEVEILESSYEDTSTGVIFPLNLKGLILESKATFQAASSGYSIEYYQEPGTRADVYVYDSGRESFPKDKDKLIEVVADQVDAVAGGLFEAQKRGLYRDVDVSEDGELTHFGTENSGLDMISSTATYRAGKAGDEPSKDSDEMLESLIAVTVFRDKFFKIRYTFPKRDKAANEANRKQRSEFVDAIPKLCLEVELRKELPKHLETFFQDPLSDAGQEAGDFIFSYADVSPLPKISLRTEWMPYLDGVDISKSPVAKSLLYAHIAGVIERQIKTGNYLDQPKAGILRVLQVYEQFRASDQSKEIAAMEVLLKRRDGGTLTEWVEKIIADDS